MFDLIPFEHRGKALNNFWDPFDGEFFPDLSKAAFPCRTDIRDEGNKYVLEAEMPGFKKEDIQINVEGDRMTLSANHQEQNEEKDENNHYIRRERSWGSVSRSFDISGIDAQKIEASYQNGVLHLDLPKVHEQKSDSRSIQIR